MFWVEPFINEFFDKGFNLVNRNLARILQDNEYPPINIYMSENDILVLAEVPGINPDEIDVSVNGDILTLCSNCGENKNEKPEEIQRKEIYSSGFSRKIKLPFIVDSEKIEAEISRGILKIVIPRAEEKSKKIQIKGS